MALDYVSILSMSIQAERLFSGTKITLEDRRNRMGGNVLEVLECLKSWLQITDVEVEIFEHLLKSIESGPMSQDMIEGIDKVDKGETLKL